LRWRGTDCEVGDGDEVFFRHRFWAVLFPALNVRTGARGHTSYGAEALAHQLPGQVFSEHQGIG
jgi:hypothetical protein